MSSVMRKRLRIYAFSAGIVVAVMAGIPPLDTVIWPRVVVTVLGLIVGILNIRGREQMDRFLFAAIGLNVTVAAFLGFSGVPESLKAVIGNFQIFITAGLVYVALSGIYEIFKGSLKTYKGWFFIAAIILVLVIWVVVITRGEGEGSFLVGPASLLLLILGLVTGYLEGPKNPDEANANVGLRFLIAAVGFQLSSFAVGEVGVEDYQQYANLLTNLKILFERSTIFTTSALLVIAFMSIFWVLDEVTDDGE